jgi:hypothetical protein
MDTRVKPAYDTERLLAGFSIDHPRLWNIGSPGLTGRGTALRVADVRQKTSETPSGQRSRPTKPQLALHHLNNFRSQRILGRFEELGTPVRYQRNEQTRLAPPGLEKIHPLGKSPLIVDGDIRIAEPGAIVDYVIRRYGKGAPCRRRLVAPTTRSG